MHRFPLVLLSVAFLFASIPAHRSDAAWPPDGNRIAPATVPQGQVFLASDDLGGAYVTWVHPRPNLGHFVQRITAAGDIASGWPVAGLQVSTMNEAPAIVADGSGGAYVAATYDHFSSRQVCLALQRVTATGAIAEGWPEIGITFDGGSEAIPSDPPVVSSPAGQSQVALALDPETNDLLMSRTQISRAAEKVWATQFQPSGAPKSGWSRDGLFMNNVFGMEWPSLIVPDGDGGAFVLYTRRFIPYQLRLNHLGSDGATNHGMLPCSTNVSLDAPGLVSDGEGGVFVFWQDAQAAHGPLFCQRILANDTFAPGWPQTGKVVCKHRTEAGARRTLGTTGSLTLSSVASDGSGGAYVAWTDFRRPPSEGGDIHAQHILANGEIAAGWPVDGLPICTVRGAQRRPMIAPDGEGGIYVSWEDDRDGTSDIYVQRVTFAGAIAPDWVEGGVVACSAPGSQHDPVVVGGTNNSAIVAWVDDRDAIGQIYAARVAPSEQVAVLASLVSAEARFDGVTVTWSLTDAGHLDQVTVFRKTPGTAWHRIENASLDSRGYAVLEDRSVQPGAEYEYAIAWDEALEPVLSTLAHVRVPNRPEFALRAPAPNPVTDDAELVFHVAEETPCAIELFDVTGRQVFAHRIPTPTVGANRFVLRRASVRAGVYLVRLTQATRQAVVRVCFVR